MALRFLGSFVAAILFIGSLTTGARAADSNDACWQLLYRAIEKSASAPHSPFISYSLFVDITENGLRYERANASIVYRDDGMAYIDDDRWVHPFLSTSLEPGPPVLGPYGPQRTSWLSLIQQGDTAMPVIADTHNIPTGRCVEAADSNGELAHLIIPHPAKDRPALKEIWIERNSLGIRRAVVSQWQTFIYDLANDGNKQHLIDYHIDVQNINGYNVVSDISWQYTYPIYSQYSTIEAKYIFSDFHFDAKAPMGTLFADAK
jgi:hypothetical protein